jgi:hypothetical protein
VIISLAVVGVAATSAAGALQGRQLFAARGGEQPTPAASSAIPPVESSSGALAADSSMAREEASPESAAPVAAAPAPMYAMTAAPVVSEGRTELGDGLFAVREGRSVTVHFDVPAARTRRRDKFDRIVRATLPRIYGEVAQSALDEIPAGQIVSAGTLPADLEKKGLRLALGDSASIELWPELRDANGGPLVVGYRAEVPR